MKRLADAVLAGSLSGVVLLAAAEALRPGFVALDGRTGWLSAVVAWSITAIVVGSVSLVWPSRFRPGAARSKLVGLVLLLTAILLSTAWIRSPGPLELPDRSAFRVLVLGIDGATWEVMDPMMAEGGLPNMTRLAAEGVTGILLSEEPTLSPRVWTTIATGVGTERHGALDFLSTQQSLQVPRIWDVVEAEGGTVGLFGWLLTWPPRSLSGFCVPGWLARGPETSPPELDFFQALRGGGAERAGASQLLSVGWRAYANGVRLPTLMEAMGVSLWMKLRRPDDRESTPRTLMVQSLMSEDIFVHWLQRVQPDFGALVLYATDTFAHRYWRDFEPGQFDLSVAPDDGRFSDVIPMAYRQADRVLGRLMELADNRTVIIVVSDHGTQASSKAKNRYSLRPEPLAGVLGSEGDVAAFSIASQVLLRPRETGEDANERYSQLLDTLQSARVADAMLFQVEETGTGFITVSLARDFEPEEVATIGQQSVELSRIQMISPFSGGHSLEGIIGLWGPPIRREVKIQAAGLRDVAPTALALMGLPVSREMEGRVLSEAFAAEIGVRRVDGYDFFSPGEAGDSDEDAEEVKKRLRALGYLQ